MQEGDRRRRPGKGDARHLMKSSVFNSEAAGRKNAPRGVLQELGVKIPAGDATLDGQLMVPAGARGIVLFVHGSGSSRHSPRNRFVARTLNEAGLGTLLFD